MRAASLWVNEADGGMEGSEGNEEKRGGGGPLPALHSSPRWAWAYRTTTSTQRHHHTRALTEPLLVYTELHCRRAAEQGGHDHHHTERHGHTDSSSAQNYAPCLLRRLLLLTLGPGKTHIHP